MVRTATTKKCLGVSAKATVLVSCLHPKDKVTKAYPNSTKDERTLEIVVSGREMHPICHKSKFVILFNHLPHGDVEEAFECWAIQRFIQVPPKEGKKTFLIKKFLLEFKHKNHNNQTQATKMQQTTATTTTTTIMKNRTYQRSYNEL